MDGGILTRNEKKVKGIRAKSDFNTVDYKLKAEETGGHGGPPLHRLTMALVGADLRVGPLDNRCTHVTPPHPSWAAPMPPSPLRGEG